MENALQASQSGYAVDYVTQGAQGGFPGNFLNQNSQAGYSRFGSGNDFMSQVCLLKTSVFIFRNHRLTAVYLSPVGLLFAGSHGSWITGAIHSGWL